MDQDARHGSLQKDPSPTLQVQRSVRNTLFRHERGLRAGWRLIIYIATIVILSKGLNLALDKVFHLPKTSTPAPWQLFLQEFLSFVLVFLPACLMAWFEHRPVGEYGLPQHSFFGKRFWQGCALGMVEVAALMSCIAAFGGYSFGPLDIHGAVILKWALYWALFFIVVGLFEEFAFRGYVQFTLADGIGFWPAAIILSVGFGGVHLGNQGEGWVGAAGVVVIALIFALTLKRTGNLWLVVGWHAAFDFGETFLFSVPNSGNVFPGHLSNSSLHGPVWLTGGTVGPEGSVFSFITMFAAAWFIHKTFPARQPAEIVPDSQPSSGGASQ